MKSKESGVNPKIYNSALKLLSARAHGTEELRRKLLKKGDASEVDKVIAELNRHKYLEDSEFSFLRARSSCIHKRWGNLRVIRDLKNLGVDDRIIRISLEKIEEELPEAERLSRVVSVYQKLHGHPASVKELKKFFDHCVRLGYPPETVRSKLGKLFSSVDWGN